MSSMAYKVARRRVLAVDELAADWKAEHGWKRDHQQANLACDVEEITKEMVSAADRVKEVAIGCGGYEPTKDAEQIANAHMVGALLERCLAVISTVKGLAKLVKRLGYDVDGFTDLSIVENEIARIKDAFVKSWMLPDTRRVAHARQQIADGKCIIFK